MAETPFLTNAVVVLVTALAVAWLFRVLRLPTVIGFLFAGMIIGPSGFDFIHHGQVGPIAELGLALLLFTVGLEMSTEPLVRVGRRLVVAAGLQLVVTSLVVFLLVLLLLPLFGEQGKVAGWLAALILGLIVANSSTAVILGHLTQQGQVQSTAGAISTTMSLLGDITGILLLILLPMMGAVEGGDWGRVGRQGLLAVGALVVIVWLARLILPRIVDWLLARGERELMTLFAVAVACSGAWVAGMAGWSWALGACIAGLVLAESDVRHQLVAEIAPFRDVFFALFFVSLGMLVELDLVITHAWLLAGAILATLVVKTALTSAAVMMAGWPLRVGLHLGLVLATVSEFSYVVAREAERAGMFPGGWLELIIAYIVGTMLLGAAITPVAEVVSAAVSGRLRPRRMKAREAEPLAEPSVSLSNHIVVVGSGFTGYSLSRALAAAKIPFCVVEMNRSLAAAARELGGEVVVGDATRITILEKAGLAAARALVVVINDRQATRRVVAQARTARPDLYILARTHYLAELDELARLGASRVISEEFESSIEILAHILKEFAIPDNVIEAEVALVRAGRYAMLRGQPVATARLELLGILQRTATQTFLLEHNSAATGRTLRELDLRAATGASIIALVRDGKPITNPGPDLEFEPNDVLVLVGTHAQIDKAKALLR